MAKQTINTGNEPNDRSGDSLRAAFTKINANFTELYTSLGLDSGGLNLGAFEFTGSTISTTDSSAVTIDQATNITSDLTVSGDVLPSVAQGGDLGSAARPWRSLYVSGNTIFIGNVPVTVDAQGNLLVDGAAVADVGTAAWDNITDKPTFAAVATSGSYADLSNRPAVPADINDLTDTANLLFDGDYSSLSNQPAIPTAVSQLTNDSGFVTSADIAGGTLTIDVNNTGDLKGSVFADDSTLLVDGVNGTIPWSVLSDKNILTSSSFGTTTANARGTFQFTLGFDDGSSFTFGPLEYAVPFDNYPFGSYPVGNITGNLTGDVTGSVFADDSTLLVDGVAGKIVGPVDTASITFADNTTQTTAFAGNAATIDITDTNEIDTNYYLTFVENRDGEEILRADIDLTFNSADNTLTAGNVTTGVLKINDGVQEKFQIKADATGVVEHNLQNGQIIYHTSPDANFTLYLTNIDLNNSYATNVVLIIEQGSTGYYPNAILVDGASPTIKWLGNVTPTPNANKIDVATFTILNVLDLPGTPESTFTVLGSYSTYG